MDLQPYASDKSFKSLIDLGMMGHYPLFSQTWIEDYFAHSEAEIKKSDQLKAKKIFKKISQMSTVEKKRIFLSTLNSSERRSFIRVFF